MIDIEHANEHVIDAAYFHVPSALWPPDGKIYLPDFGTYELFGYTVDLQLTKFMVLELVAAVVMLAIFIPLARRMRHGGPPKGRIWNAFEAVLVFLRDEVARPAIGRHDADRFLPFIWSIFFFVLFCNLLGMLPWAGSPTGALSTTAALAAVTFCVVTGAGMKRYGLVKFWTGLVPHVELPFILAIFLVPMIFFIEVGGIALKHAILSIRLLANMFAGHLVLAAILGFIAATANSWIWYGVTPVTMIGALAVSLLELFVAFLQAYIFAFLSALFIGMAVHQH